MDSGGQTARELECRRHAASRPGRPGGGEVDRPGGRSVCERRRSGDWSGKCGRSGRGWAVAASVAPGATLIGVWRRMSRSDWASKRRMRLRLSEARSRPFRTRLALAGVGTRFHSPAAGHVKLGVEPERPGVAPELVSQAVGGVWCVRRRAARQRATIRSPMVNGLVWPSRRSSADRVRRPEAIYRIYHRAYRPWRGQAVKQSRRRSSTA